MDLHQQRVAPIPSSQVPEKLGLSPALRGFWTDEEMLVDSGISSVATLKKLAGARWIIPDHIPIPEGGRRRVWSFTEVVHAAVVREVSTVASLPLIATGLVLHGATAAWVDAAVDLSRRIDWMRDRPSLQTTSKNARLVIVDGREGWREVGPGRFEQFARHMSLTGAKLAVDRARTPTEADLETIGKRGASVHIIDLSQLDLSLFGRIREAGSVAAKRREDPR